MKTLIVLILCGCLWAVPATAQIDPNPDGVGIYADLDGLVNQVELEIGVPMEVYLLLTRPSGTGGIWSWEGEIIVPDNVSIWGWNNPIPGALSIASPPAFVVGYPEVFPYQVTNHLMTFIIVPEDSEPAQFYITGNSHPSGAPYPRYIDYDESRPHPDEALLMPMTPYPDGLEGAAFTVNPDPTAVVSASWGGVKALYR